MRGTLTLACLLCVACQYGYDLDVGDREVVNCTGRWDCGDREVCRGIVSEDAACTADGYLRIADGKASDEPVDDQPSLFFFCHENRRFYPFCVDEQVTTCEYEDPCNGTQECASPVGGGEAECVTRATSPAECTSDNDCSAGQECYLIFVLGEESDAKRIERRCADCTTCIF
jgi:hypothetical protein